MGCSHTWVIGLRKIDEKLVAAIRRCTKCGEEELVWNEMDRVCQEPDCQRIMQSFYEHLKHCFEKEWEERIKNPPGLGYPMGGILYTALVTALEDFGIEKVEL